MASTVPVDYGPGGSGRSGAEQAAGGYRDAGSVPGRLGHSCSRNGLGSVAIDWRFCLLGTRQRGGTIRRDSSQALGLMEGGTGYVLTG